MAKINKTNSGGDAEEKEPSFTVGGFANWSNHYGSQYGELSKR